MLCLNLSLCLKRNKPETQEWCDIIMSALWDFCTLSKDYALVCTHTHTSEPDDSCNVHSLCTFCIFFLCTRIQSPHRPQQVSSVTPNTQNSITVVSFLCLEIIELVISCAFFFLKVLECVLLYMTVLYRCDSCALER